MASSIHTTMPGSFLFENSFPPRINLAAGPKGCIFQAPTTPSASGSPYRSTPSLSTQNTFSGRSRKRSRQDTPLHDGAVPDLNQPQTCSSSADPASTVDAPCTLSPIPLVNTNYKLAGGCDMPTAVMERGEQDYWVSPELHCRGGGGFERLNTSAADSLFFESSSALAREASGRSRLPPTPTIRDGFGKAVYNVVGAAGKVWEFCRTNAIRGFYAGGGKGYEIKTSLQSLVKDPGIRHEFQRDDGFQKDAVQKSLVPGCFPEEDFIPEYMSHNHTSPPRAAKKMRRENGVDEISASWMMVESRPTLRKSSPSRLSTRKAPLPKTPTRRPTPKLGRRQTLHASRPSLTLNSGSSGFRSERHTSPALPSSPVTAPGLQNPASVEIQRHVARIRRRELEDDANLKRFNYQLRAMIREGKEALGTKIEVDIEREEPVDERYRGGDQFSTVGKR